MTRMRGITAALAGLAVAVGLVPPPAAPAATQPAATQPAATQPAATELAPLMIVLDASGSMAQKAAGGTKMTAAKKAVRTVVGTLPEGVQIGLTVYGANTGSSDAEKAAGCKDVKVVHPVSTLDRAGIVRAAEAARPRGYTPIGTALRTAAGALPKEGPRSIVLVSDGEDTCAPPEPCQVANELAEQGVDLRVHTVGYQVDGKAKNQLTCIAQATGGTYTNVPDAADLGAALGRVTNSALRNYQAAGTPVSGTYTIDGAPVLTPGGYLDTLGFARKRHYSVEIPEGYTAYFAATVPFERGGRHNIAGLNISLYGVGGADCNRTENTVTSGGKDGEALTTLFTWNGSTAKTSQDACKKAGRYTLAVYFSSAADGGTVAEDEADRVPVELQVGLEPPVADPGPAAAPRPTEYAAPIGPAQQVVGGGSFGTAATLPGTGQYAEPVEFGEIVYYRVRVAWGQGVAYRVEYGLNDLRGSAANIESALYSPARGRVAWQTTAYTGAAKALPYDEPGFTTLPVRYQNRALNDREEQAQSVAGWYYIVVKLGRASGGGEHLPVPVTLKVSLTGSQEPGPTYADVDAGEDAFGGTGGGSASSGQATSTPAGQVALKPASEQSSLLCWVVAAVVVAALVAAGAVGTVLAVRRRGTRTP